MASTDKLLDRVQKLLALAGSPNVHEAAAAAAAAQRLIEVHRLQGLLDAQQAAQAQPVTDGRAAPLESSKRLRRWKIHLASCLAQANGCIAYTAQVGRQRQLLVAGRDEDRQLVAALWDWLVHRIALASATEAGDQRLDKAWHEAFRVGAAEVVAARLAESGAQVRAELTTTALATVEPALAKRQEAVDRFAEQELRLKAGRGLRVDADAYARGRAAGADLPLP